jgi:hypothetical protein
MRAAVLLSIAALCLLAEPPPALSVPTAAPPVAAAPSPDILQVRRCGPGRRWVPRHRTRSGRWINGRCVRTRRR